MEENNSRQRKKTRKDSAETSATELDFRFSEKNQQAIIKNQTIIEFKDYFKYREFTSALTARRGISRIMQFLLPIATISFLVPLFMDLGKHMENGDTLKIILSFIIMVGTLFATVLNIYALFYINRWTMLARRIGMFITCLLLLYYLAPDFGKDIFVSTLVILLPSATFIGIFLPYYLVHQEYKKVLKMKYDYNFDEDSLDVKVDFPGLEAPNNVNIKYETITLFFELDDVYYLFINPRQAIFVKKSGFTTGDSDGFLKLLAKYQKMARLVKW